MRIARKRIPKLAATGLLLAGCGDDGSSNDKFVVEEIDALVTEYCMHDIECSGSDEDFDLDECRFYLIFDFYSHSLLNEQAACDQAITALLDCSITSPCNKPTSCEDEEAEFEQLCPGTFTEGR